MKINEVDHHTWIFTSRIFRLALEIAFLLNHLKWLTSYSLKVGNLTSGEILTKAGRVGGGGRLENLLKKNKRVGRLLGTLDRDNFHYVQT